MTDSWEINVPPDENMPTNPLQMQPIDEIDEIVRELYRGILKREPDPEYLRQHSERLRSNGFHGELSKLVDHFITTQEFKAQYERSNRLSKLMFNSSRTYLDRINKEFADSIPADSRLLDVGAGQAPYRQLFAHTRYESADFEKVIKPYGETTYVCDITIGIPVENDRFDFLLFNQTLEHIKDPILALRELYRVLAPGGKMLCTVPLFYEEHEQPYDFYRYTKFGLQYMFMQTGFQIEKIDWLEGFFGTCGYMLECIAKYAPRDVPDTIRESLWAKAFLSAFRPLALSAAAAFYHMDVTWKVTNTGFPKNYVIYAKKPATVDK